MDNNKKELVRPGIGTGIWVLNKSGQVLISYRKKNKLYGFPGGHLERYNTWEECASLELEEETGLKISPGNIYTIGAINISNKDANYHYVELAMVCEYDEIQKIVNVEPENHGDWEWWSFDDIKKRKSELFYPTQVMLDDHGDIFCLEHLTKILAQKKNVENN